jgi:hypothetical protein
MKIWLFALASLCNADVTKTALTFTRKINTCDPWDRPLQNATSKIIWSYNDNDPTSESNIQYHQKRGVTSVRFFNPDTSEPHLPPDAQSFDIKMDNVEIKFNNPNMGATTDYWCAGFKIDQFTEKNHVIRVEPVIDPRNYAQVHHIVLYQCDGELTEEDMAYRGSCFTANMPTAIYSCNGAKMIHVWAVGGTPFDYPDHVGYPIGPNTTYVVLQLHYENPTMVKLVDSSGLKFWYTPTLRTYDASVGIYGHTVDDDFVIPPFTPSMWFNAWCPSECTEANLPKDGIKVLGAALHTHTAGVSVKVQQFRNGVELPPPADEPYYDFNYQDYIIFNPEMQILPGDELYVSCRYDTSSRPNPTPMGLSTNEEMCLIYFVYYPALAKSNEGCYYGDWTNISGSVYNSSTAFCRSDLVIRDYVPKNHTPYVPPPCVYSPPPVNRTTPTLSKSLINPADYDRNQFLDMEQKYKLYWSIDKQNLVFRGAVEVETPGWVGLGISEFGMEGADVFIGWVKDDEVYFADRFATKKQLPGIDANQDFYDIKGSEVTLTPSSSGLTTRQIAGLGAAGGAVFVLLIFGLIYVIRKRNNNRKYGYIGTDEEDTIFVADTGAVKM